MNIVTTDSTIVQNLKRVVKFLRFGKKDVQTATQYTPHGIDSNPVEGMKAIYAETGEKGKTIIIGYLSKSVLAEVGETRIFSTDTAGALKAYAWFKADGTTELSGNTKNLVRFQELETGFNQLKTDFNNLVTLFNSHVHTGVTTGGGSSGPPAASGSSSIASIAGAKIDEIKTL